MKKYFKISFFSIILIMMITFIPNVSAKDEYAKCDYNLIRVYYNKTTDEFKKEIIKSDIRNVQFEYRLVKSDFINKSDNKLYCPTLYMATRPGSDYTNIYTYYSSNQSDVATREIKPTSSDIYNEENHGNNNKTTTCVYHTEIGNVPVAEYVLDTTNKQIKSFKVKDYSVDSPYSYSEVYDGNYCKNVSLYYFCHNYNNMPNCSVSKESKKDFIKLTLDNNKSTGGKDTNTGGKDDDPKKDNGYAEEIKNFFLGKTTCGGITSFTFPDILPKITSSLYNLLKVAVPVILIIKGMLDMFKAATSQKEDEMKKAQKKFVQRLIAGILALLVFIIVETIISFIAKGTGNDNAWGCVDCFINNKCK